jgi:hypothetical protein
VGQTARNLKTRYEEHTNYIRLHKYKSKYDVHILQENHEYGQIDKTMEILKVANKEKYLDIWERLYIHTYIHTYRQTSRFKHVLNEQHIGETNVPFDLLINYDHDIR